MSFTEPTLVLVRGLPGSGKSTLAGIIAPNANVAADDYFDIVHGGKFVLEEIATAHTFCKTTCKIYMQEGRKVIAIHNTFTRETEFEEYVKLAEKYGYKVHTIIVENRHGNSSIHNVPGTVMEKMKSRFEVKL